MIKLIKKIKLKLKKIFFKKKQKKVFVKSILCIHQGLKSDSIYLETLNNLKEDFKITIINFDLQKQASFKNTNNFDFVLIISSFENHLHKSFKKIKNSKTVSGLLLIDENRLPTSIKESNKYDLIWFRTFDFASKIKTSSKLIHAFGFEENEKNISIENEILKLRQNKDFVSRVDLHSHEFSKSPIWDYKYFKMQIQKGLNSFYNIEIRKTNLIESSKNIKVGKFSFFNKNLVITGDEYVSIGSFCSFGKDITVYTSNHDTNYPSTQGFIYRKYFNVNHPGEVKINPSKSRTKGPVIIKNDVWIGDSVKVMSGVTIGNGACIGAGAIVTKDVDDYEIVAGIPAKNVGYRFNKNIRQQLLELNWWDWSDYKIENNKTFFSTDLNTIENISDLIN